MRDNFANTKRTTKKIRATPVERSMGDDRGWNMSGGSEGSFGHVFGPHGCAWVVGEEKWHPAGHFGFFWVPYACTPACAFFPGPLAGGCRGPWHPQEPPPLFWVADELVPLPTGAAVPQRGFWGVNAGRFLCGCNVGTIKPWAAAQLEPEAG